MKKMDRRGFTLVEVLAVLVILTIILSIAIPSISASLERSKGKQVTASNELVLRAAELYVNDYKSNIVNNMDSDECYINVSDLSDGDYITSSNNDLYNIEYVIYNKTNNLISEIPSDKTVDNYSACNRNEYLIPEGDTGSDGSSVKYLLNHVHLGDYVQMVPNTVSEGYSKGRNGMSVTTLNTRELKLWRVIKITNDSIEMISNNVSKASVKFEGKVGYQYYIDNLNYLSSLYENPDFTQGSRYLGYCSEVSSVLDRSDDFYNGNIDTNSSNWIIDNEPSGGGDRHDLCYDKDLILLEKAGVSLTAKKDEDDTNNSSYYLASRNYMKKFDSGNYWQISKIDENGDIGNIMIVRYYSGYSINTPSFSIRPIVILKRDVTYTEGEGTRDKPFVLG